MSKMLKTYSLTKQEIDNLRVSKGLATQYRAKANVAEAGYYRYLSQILKRLSISEDSSQLNLRIDMDKGTIALPVPEKN